MHTIVIQILVIAKHLTVIVCFNRLSKVFDWKICDWVEQFRFIIGHKHFTSSIFSFYVINGKISNRIRKVLESKSNTEDDKVAVSEAQLAQAKQIAEEADRKYEEVE